jgi:hypothetical protein
MPESLDSVAAYRCIVSPMGNSEIGTKYVAAGEFTYQNGRIWAGQIADFELSEKKLATGKCLEWLAYAGEELKKANISLPRTTTDVVSKDDVRNIPDVAEPSLKELRSMRTIGCKVPPARTDKFGTSRLYVYAVYTFADGSQGRNLLGVFPGNDIKGARKRCDQWTSDVDGKRAATAARPPNR